MSDNSRRASLHEDISRAHAIKRGSARSVGVVFAVVFAIVALYPLLEGGKIRLWSAGIALALLVVALLIPKLLEPLNRAWFRFGLALNLVTSPIILGFLYYVVITPIGLLMRLTGNDPLRLAFKSDEKSFWIERSPPGPAPESMKHQF